MEFVVREATPADADALAALSGELGYPADAGAVRGRLARILACADDRVVVAQAAGGAVCGWLQAHRSEVLESGLRVEIMGLVVAAGARRSGVGRALVADAEAWAARVRAGCVVVRSNVKRTESHLFYPSLGYEPSKTQAVYRKRLGA